MFHLLAHSSCVCLQPVIGLGGGRGGEAKGPLTAASAILQRKGGGVRPGIGLPGAGPSGRVLGLGPGSGSGGQMPAAAAGPVGLGAGRKPDSAMDFDTVR